MIYYIHTYTYFENIYFTLITVRICIIYQIYVTFFVDDKNNKAESQIQPNHATEKPHLAPEIGKILNL